MDIRRCFLSTVVIFTLCSLITLYFLTDRRLKPIPPSRAILPLKQWTLFARNQARLTRLRQKYNVTLFLKKSSSKKTMIYSCQSFCGGWGDRLRGILSVYILALLTDRHFMIDMNYPCDIFHAIQPNLVNWTYIPPSKSVNRTQLRINTMASWKTSYRNEISSLIKTKDFSRAWSSYDDIFISTNSDYATIALRNTLMLKQTRQLLGQTPTSQGTFQTLFALLFEILFKPSGSVHQRVNTILAASANRHLICLHIRIGKNPTNPLDHAFTARGNITKTMLGFTEQYPTNGSSPIVFVTSDSGEAVSEVLHYYPNSSMTIVGPILHIDRFDRRSSTVCDGFIKVIADFYMLGECQTSLLSSSGFSSWANQRRMKPNEEVYVYNDNSGRLHKVI